MKKILHFFKKEFQKPVFWFAIFMNSVFLMWCSQMMPHWFPKISEIELQQPDLLWGISWSLSYDVYSMILPVIVSISSVLAFYDEIHEKAYRFKMIRVGKVRYVSTKIMETFLSGMLIMLLSFLVYTIVIYLYGFVYGLPVTCMQDDISFSPEDMYAQMLLSGRGWLVYGIKILFVSVYASTWAMFGTALVVFIANKRVAVVGPFILKSFLQLVGYYIYFYAGGSNVLILDKYQLQLGLPGRTLGGVIDEALYLMVVWVICIVIVYVGMERIYRKQG